MEIVNRVRAGLAWRYTKARDSTVFALAELNRRWVDSAVFVGITGSAGKTTTKDLAVSILKRGGRVTANEASMNYLAEVAQVVLSAKRSDRYVVIEVATSKPGDIATKAALVRPSIAALTVVQREHVKNFESLEAIAEEKGRLIEALPKEGVAVLNADDEQVRRVGERVDCRKVWFGASADADIRLVEAKSVYPDPLTLSIDYQGRRYDCVTSLHGVHLAVPALAAIGLGIAAGIPIEECIDALAEVHTTPGRMQIVNTPGDVTFLRDDHKAPYWSFQAALDFLRDAKARRKVAVIGTISDYSLSASKVYPKIARQAREAAELVVFVGPHALRALKARKSEDDVSIVGFTDLEEANDFLMRELRAGDLVLLKGSNRADHLIRLMLSRSRSIGCWERGCGWSRFCDACPRLDQPVSSAPERPRFELVGVRGSMEAVERGASESATVRQTEVGGSWLVVGLGNPGEGYVDTPHNVGFDAADYLALNQGAEWESDPDGFSCQTQLGGQDVVLFKAATPINLCGPVVARARERFGIAPDKLIVVHDDMDLSLGDVRLKHQGSDGGHKGLRSLFAALGNEGFMSRVRIGVRKPEAGTSSAKSMVLERFASADQEVRESALDQVERKLKSFIESKSA